MSAVRHTPVARTVRWRLPSGHAIDRHRHDEHQIVCVSAGVLEVQTPAGSWVVSRERAVWLPAGTWHEHLSARSSIFHTMGFPAGESPWPEPDPALVFVSPLLRELLVACADPELTRAEVRRMRAVVGDQLRRSPQRPMALPAPRDPRLVEACTLIRERLDARMTLVELARHVATSETTLSRLFRQDLGMTFPQWRTNARLLEAVILLSEGTSVTETARVCGWSTTSSFIDTFRRSMGQTPGSYKVGVPSL